MHKLFRSKFPAIRFLTAVQTLDKHQSPFLVPHIPILPYSDRFFGSRFFHDGRPRGPLWRGKKSIGKEALFVILGLKRFKNDEEKLGKFLKSHVSRLLKMDLVTVLGELERQEEGRLALKVRFRFDLGF